MREGSCLVSFRSIQIKGRSWRSRGRGGWYQLVGQIKPNQSGDPLIDFHGQAAQRGVKRVRCGSCTASRYFQNAKQSKTAGCLKVAAEPQRSQQSTSGEVALGGPLCVSAWHCCLVVAACVLQSGSLGPHELSRLRVVAPDLHVPGRGNWAGTSVS